MHAATFGGNPLAARAGLAALDMIEEENLLENALRISGIFRQRLEELQTQVETIQEVRVLGVMIGLDLSIEGAPAVQACMERGLLINCTQGHVLRLLPAMNLTPNQVHEGCDILAEVLTELGRQPAL
jgi:acetylornithine/succinyldiaminopimelate/putrescine aminotransferase